MENQHRKITGYRELSQEEIDLMNAIKAQGSKLLELQRKLAEHLAAQRCVKTAMVDSFSEGAKYPVDPHIELARFNSAEPERWAAIGKTDIQTGIMALVRAVDQPAGV